MWLVVLWVATPHQLVVRQFVGFLYLHHHRRFHFIWVTNLFCGPRRQTDRRRVVGRALKRHAKIPLSLFTKNVNGSPSGGVHEYLFLESGAPPVRPDQQSFCLFVSDDDVCERVGEIPLSINWITSKLLFDFLSICGKPGTHARTRSPLDLLLLLLLLVGHSWQT